jgi:hypothetical protein
VPIFKQIASLLACVERCKVGDFVCKKAGIEWERESSGEVRYLALGANEFHGISSCAKRLSLGGRHLFFRRCSP